MTSSLEALALFEAEAKERMVEGGEAAGRGRPLKGWETFPTPIKFSEETPFAKAFSEASAEEKKQIMDGLHELADMPKVFPGVQHHNPPHPGVLKVAMFSDGQSKALEDVAQEREEAEALVTSEELR